MIFSAIDFETANYKRHSACAVGLVRVEDGEITRKNAYLIRPPDRWFVFTHIHGLTWDHVASAPSFKELWPELEPFFHKADFLVAHNAAFDRAVLCETCNYYGISPPRLEFKCTVKLARRILGIYPTKLPDVCRALGISLNHHEALSDALACAKIMLNIVES